MKFNWNLSWENEIEIEVGNLNSSFWLFWGIVFVLIIEIYI